jgi:hypothetical protein
MDKFRTGDRVIVTRNPTRQECQNGHSYVKEFERIKDRVGKVERYWQYDDMMSRCSVYFDNGQTWTLPDIILDLENPKQEKKEMNRKLYIEFQQKVGLREGDMITLTGRADDQQFGWAGDWDSDLDDKEGEEATIVSVSDSYGYEIRFLEDIDDDDTTTYYIPFFCAKKLDRPSRAIVKLTGDYSAIVSPFGIKVGCQDISYQAFDELVQAVSIHRR